MFYSIIPLDDNIFPSKESVMQMPTRRIITNVYIAVFQQFEHVFKKKRLEASIQYLTFDHTFKVSSRIGYHDSDTNKFVKQYSSLFFAMNEKGQIVEYQLTKSTTV